jgi:murein DD-endopeptidase MepM/ murein hydrolase activator NlpD
MAAPLLALVNLNSMKTKFDIREVTTLVLGLLMFASPVVASAATVYTQPGPFPVGMDTWYGSVYNTSSQHDGNLRVGGWGDEYDSLVRFDLSGLPLTATQAVVWLYAHPAGGTPVNINWYQNTTQWHTGSVSWSTRPSGNYLGYTYAPSTIPGWYGVIFTSQYNAWRSGNPSSPNYGLALKPTANNNNFDEFYGSGYTGNPSLRPELGVTYNTSGTDSIPKFKWPLATPSYGSRTVTQAFGAFPWAGGTECPTGYQKYHNGTDYSASAGTTEYAPEDGIVKEVTTDSSGWGSNVVMEHTSPTGSKYTSVIWHITPNSDVIYSNPGGFIPKGAPLGTVANLTYPKVSHFHFGMRMAAYSYPTSGAGALPQTNCGGYLAFPASFVNVESTSNVIISN